MQFESPYTTTLPTFLLLLLLLLFLRTASSSSSSSSFSNATCWYSPSTAASTVLSLPRFKKEELCGEREREREKERESKETHTQTKQKQKQNPVSAYLKLFFLLKKKRIYIINIKTLTTHQTIFFLRLFLLMENVSTHSQNDTS